MATAMPLTSAAMSVKAGAATPYLRRTIPIGCQTLSITRGQRRRTRSTFICCDVALKSINDDASVEEDEEIKGKLEKVGSRVRVKAPLKVYHVPRVPEVELSPGTEGVVKQYIGFWKGKRISANLPFKVEFLIDVPGRDGPVKFFAHLKEDEFDFI